MRYALTLKDFPPYTDATIVVQDVRLVRIVGTDGTDITEDLAEVGTLTDGTLTPFESYPLEVAKTLAEYINTTCYTPCDVVAVDAFDTVTEGFYIQPFSSQQVKEDRTTVREDLALQLVYSAPVSSSSVFLFDRIERAVDGKMFAVGNSSVLCYSFAYNSPVSVNKMTNAEGFVDTEELGDRLTAVTSALIYVRRWFSEVK